MAVRLMRGDCRDVLKTLPDESVHCVVTSPPYWGLRDYGVAGQLGMEISLGEHVETMVSVFREVRRVLRSDGTLWLNYGDSYAASPNGRVVADIVNDDRTFRDKPFSTIGPVWRPGSDRCDGKVGMVGHRNRNGMAGLNTDLKPKDLCGIPWRVAFALQADGWWLRQDIIWSKPNPMPESVTDRCTKAHEYIFLLSKSAQYHYDAEAIKEAAEYGENRATFLSGTERLRKANVCSGGLVPSDRGMDRVPGMKAVGTPRHDGDRWNSENGRGFSPRDSTRNKRSVWEVATAPFSEAHFATFPPALIEPCILAGCPKGGTVLDPFGGAGTTGLVADRLRRNAILIELNPEYAEMAERRIKQDAGMFAEVGL